MLEKLLMIPGPTPINKKVLKILSMPVKPHYGDKWKKTYFSIIKKLKKIVNSKNFPLLVPGSGTYVMEAAISSLLNKNDNVLICYNGYWAERLNEICLSYNLNVSFLKAKFNSPINILKLENILKKKKKIKMVLFVHVETSTGLDNPIKEICNLCSKYGVLSLVDSVGGLGGVEINFDKMKIDILASSSQKCLNSPAGLGILFLSDKAKKMQNKKKSKLGWSLNLHNIDKYKKNWREWHPHGPTTAPVSLYLALEKSIDLILKQGLKKRYLRHIRIKNLVRTKLRKKNLELFVKDDTYASSALTTFLLPNKIKLKNFLNIMDKKYNITLSGDLGYVNKRLVRIAHMGNSANYLYINQTLTALEAILFKNKK